MYCNSGISLKSSYLHISTDRLRVRQRGRFLGSQKLPSRLIFPSSLEEEKRREHRNPNTSTKLDFSSPFSSLDRSSMAPGGSSGRAGSGLGARSFEFGSDDVLCSYDDYEVRDASNAKRSEPAVKDSREDRTGRPLVNVFSQQEDYPKEDVICAVEKCMKKYADNLLRFLEGISGRLSQLEAYCYKLERAIGELRSDLSREQSEADIKLKSLEKHIQEVHRSVQILRDKQELAEAQKELAKFHLVQKVSPSPSRSKLNEGNVTPSIESQKLDGIHDVPNHHLALALPHQIPAPTSVPARASEQQTGPASLNIPQEYYSVNQVGTYYPQQPDIQYVPKPHVQILSLQAPPLPQQIHITSKTQPQPVPQYQQQWPQQSSQQLPQQVLHPTQSTSQAQIRPQTAPNHPPYPSRQHMNHVTETYPGSSAMQASYSAIPPSAGAHPEAVPFSYGGPVSSVPQPPRAHPNMLQSPPPQPSQSSFGPNVNKSGYMGTVAFTPVVQPSVQGYSTMYGFDGGRGAHAQNLQPGSYPPNNAAHTQSQQLPAGSSVGLYPGQQPMRSHPYAELIERAIGMGYARDHVLSMVHIMGESGQPVDFNALLDRLNARTSGASTRTWSG